MPVAVSVSRDGEPAILPAPIVDTGRDMPPEGSQFDKLSRHGDSVRETFIPITKTALIDRLTHADAWAEGDAEHARRFFLYLDYWRRQRYSAALRDVDKLYEAFNPDSDLLATRAYSESERARMQAIILEHVQVLLKQANYVQVNRDEI